MWNSIAAMENSMASPQNNETELPHDPEIPFLGIYLKTLQRKTQTLISTLRLTAAIHTIIKKQK